MKSLCYRGYHFNSILRFIFHVDMVMAYTIFPTNPGARIMDGLGNKQLSVQLRMLLNASCCNVLQFRFLNWKWHQNTFACVILSHIFVCNIWINDSKMLDFSVIIRLNTIWLKKSAFYEYHMITCPLTPLCPPDSFTLSGSKKWKQGYKILFCMSHATGN